MNLELKEIPEYADVMTIEEWGDSVACGGFIPDDGGGCWATTEGMDNGSNVWDGEPPEWATHVAWFNR